MTVEREDLASLIAGNKPAWDQFVVRYAGLITAAARRVVGPGSGLGGGPGGEVEDIVQEVFLRLCKDQFRLLRQYDPARAGLTTWLTVVARSVAHDAIRRRRAPTQTLDDTPEAAFAVEPKFNEPIKLPPDLLSPRQQLVITMLYERDLDVSEIAATLGVDAQTVRSTHHKAMIKLRGYFRENA